MEIEELCKKVERASKHIGWKSYHSIDLEYDSLEVGDLWLAIDINNSYLDKAHSIDKELNKARIELEKIFPSAKDIRILQEIDDETAKFVVRIQLK